MRKAAVLVLILLLSVISLAALPGVQAAPGGAGIPSSVLPMVPPTGTPVAQDLLDLMGKALDQTPIPVIVQLSSPVTPAVLSHLQGAAGPFSVEGSWPHALPGAFLTRMPPAQIQRLAQVPGILRIEPDRPVEAFLDTATLWTGVQQARRDFGVTGSGITVAIIDTGIDTGHVDLPPSKVIGWYDAVRGKPTPYDDNGHGTHVASIAGGLGKGNPAYTGVAPGASLVGIKVLDAQGSGTTSGILAGIDWMIQNKGRYNIRVGNMSLGASGCSDGLDALSSAVNSAVDQGIIMVVAAGNSGPNRCTIGAPGAAAKAITVGASYDPGERGWALAEFSSRGPTADGRVKPDIVAPGRNITAAKAGTASGYVTYSGTSMATPFISGVVALMLSANPSLTDSQVKSYLFASEAVKHFGASGKNIDYGYGLTVAYHAVRLAGSFTGSFGDGLKYSFAQDSLSGTGQRRDYTFTVTDATAPIGITLIMAQNPSCRGLTCTPDFDLYLYDPSGTLVASSTSTKRQEQITYQPTRTGQYTLRVTSYSGSGTYTLDVSWR